MTGRPEAIGGALTSSPVVRKLSFTGSTRVGVMPLATSARTAAARSGASMVAGPAWDVFMLWY